MSLSLDTDIAADENLFGKVIANLQGDDIEIDDTDMKITGTIHYVTGYTQYSPGNVEEQSGYYLATHASAEPVPDSITIELLGGVRGHPTTLDSDGISVCRFTNIDTQKIQVVAWRDGASVVKTYDLSGLTLEEP